MSMEADWYSTIFPLLVCISQMLGALAFVIILIGWLGPRTSLFEILSKENFHHLGNLLLTFTMLWAYLAYAQLIVIWSGDLPHEIGWYLHRIAGGNDRLFESRPLFVSLQRRLERRARGQPGSHGVRVFQRLLGLRDRRLGPLRARNGI